MTTKRPLFIQKGFECHNHWARKPWQLLICFWPRISAHWLSWDDAQRLNVVETQEQAEEIPFIQRTRPCCYATDKALKRGRATIVLSLSRGQSFIHAMFFCHYHDPFSFENCFSKLQKEPRLVQELLKEPVPLSLTMRAAESLLLKVLLSGISDDALFSAHRALSFRLLAADVSSWAGVTAKQIITASQCKSFIPAFVSYAVHKREWYTMILSVWFANVKWNQLCELSLIWKYQNI